MNISKIFGTIIAVAFVPLCHASTARYIAATAPDAVSVQILSQPVLAFEEGAAGSSDIAAAIHRNYPKIIEQNVAAMKPAEAMAWIDRLSELELEHTAQLYVNANATASRTGMLITVMAYRLDGARLGRLSRFFGYNEVYSAIAVTAPEKLQSFLDSTPTAFAAPTVGASLRAPSTSALMLTDSGTIVADDFKPQLNMTIEELYSGFRSMMTGSMAETAAVYEVAQYAGKNLVVPFGTGYAFGTEISNLMQEYTPNYYYNTFVPSVGGSISAAVDFVQNTVLSVFNFFSDPPSLGQYQKGTIPTYGNAGAVQSNMGSTGGDYGMTIEYQSLTHMGGSCNLDGAPTTDTLGGSCPIDPK